MSPSVVSGGHGRSGYRVLPSIYKVDVISVSGSEYEAGIGKVLEGSEDRLRGTMQSMVVC